MVKLPCPEVPVYLDPTFQDNIDPLEPVEPFEPVDPRAPLPLGPLGTLDVFHPDVIPDVVPDEEIVELDITRKISWFFNIT